MIQYVKTPELRDEIIKLQRRSFDGYECAPDGIVHDVIGNPETTIFATRGQTVGMVIPPLMGYALVNTKKGVDPNYEHEPYIWSIAVDEKYRRQGVGGYLLDEVACYAREQGFLGTILICKTDNDAAISVYRAHDYDVIRTLRGYYVRGDGFLMRRKV